MTPVKHALSEHDTVLLREPIGEWPAGTVGVVISAYLDALLVEVVGTHGETLDTITVRPEGLVLSNS
ncbi:MAG TPA: hypothetical protein VGF63_09555 [Solirubrobacteraceae bacterium]|jgi:hypothetical protein